MSKVTRTYCDRCGCEISSAVPKQIQEGTPDRWKRNHTDWMATHDLCTVCKKAFEHFMAGEDEVGEYVFEQEEVPGECPHRIPCADPSCGTTWQWKRHQRSPKEISGR